MFPAKAVKISKTIIKSSSYFLLNFPKKVFHNSSFKMSDWQTEKEKLLSMNLLEKRELYDKNKDYTKLEDILSWKQYFRSKCLPKKSKLKLDFAIRTDINDLLSSKVAIFEGDITSLEIDAIVNAANKALRGGGGVDGVIHRVAGPLLLKECITFNGCETGDARITGGYNLPAKYVIHTPGPQGEKPKLLQQCYRNCLQVMLENKLRSIAFPCISTGIYGYPNDKAANIAAAEIRKCLEEHAEEIDCIIFCVFLEKDLKLYEDILQSYFPVQ